MNRAQARTFSWNDNDLVLDFDPVEAVQVMEGVGAGRITESELALWLRSRLGT